MGLPKEQHIPLWSNHMDMCRFSGPQSPDFLAVEGILKQLSAKACQKKVEKSNEVRTVASDPCTSIYFRKLAKS